MIGQPDLEQSIEMFFLSDSALTWVNKDNSQAVVVHIIFFFFPR